MVKYLAIHDVDGIESLEIVEADSPNFAATAAGSSQMLTGEWKDQEVALVGLYEIGQFNHLESIEKLFDTHKYYRNKIQELGFDPNTFKEIK